MITPREKKEKPLREKPQKITALYVRGWEVGAAIAFDIVESLDPKIAKMARSIFHKEYRKNLVQKKSSGVS